MPPQNDNTAKDLQWKRLKKLRLVGPRLAYLTRLTPVDSFLEKTLLPLIPYSVSPNSITVFRFICIPIVAYLLISGNTLLGFVVFILAACSDLFDGALARTRRQITKWGIVADPIADKLLIGTVSIIAISKYLGWRLAALIITIEMLLVLTAYLRYRGRLMPARMVGKLKMVFQCVGVGFILLFAVFPNPLFLFLGRYVLYLAVIFAVVSLFVYRSI